MPDRPLTFTGDSYDNTGKLGADTWRHVAFIEQPARRRRRSGCASAAPGRPPRIGRGDGLPVAHVVRRVQALHRGGVPRRLPDRVALPDGVRHRGRAGGHLQRLRLLRPGVSVRRDRSAPGRRPGLEVHALLRPAEGWSGTGLRAPPARPSRSSSVRWTSFGSEQPDGSRELQRARRRVGPAVRRVTGRRGRRLRRVLPPARRPGGVRVAARSGRHDSRSRIDVASSRRWQRSGWRRRPLRRWSVVVGRR